MIARLLPYFDSRFVFATLTQLHKGCELPYKKVQIKPFLQGEELRFQFTYVHDKKVTHENLSPNEAAQTTADLLAHSFHQCILHTTEQDYHMTCFGKLKIKTQPPTKADQQNLAHNKRKTYLLPEDVPCDFLIHLGVMNEQGKVLKHRYDKFRQINKYLELVADSVAQLPQNRRLHIVDFGCGKSYLTFALYYYLVQVLRLDVKIIGLDLKEDVVAYCNQVAQQLHYTDLTFLTGDIQSYVSDAPIDMVVTLHACDTATDAAIVQAVNWDSKVLLTVPCCQHELFDQIQNPEMQLLTKHGILKERVSALITDTIRGELLEACGYEVGIMEFISMEHTPKNILIKAVKKGGYDKAAHGRYLQFAKAWQIHPYLEQALVRTGRIPERQG